MPDWKLRRTLLYAMSGSQIDLFNSAWRHVKTFFNLKKLYPRFDEIESGNLNFVALINNE